MTAPIRAALYLRVSTSRQAQNDLSIPDQRRQASGHCTSRGWEIVADYVERLAKNGVRLISITQELGDDPMSNMIRQIMALFDEYQSKENAKHTLRAMKENARQGFWNGALPPIGYRIVEARPPHQEDTGD